MADDPAEPAEGALTPEQTGELRQILVQAFPDLPPEQAIEFFRQKGLLPAYSWQDVWQGEHARSFTVAKAMSRELLETIRAQVDTAIADGTTLATFREQLQPQLEQVGWWGRKQMLDPLTGRLETVQLGSPRRLETIFNVNMRTAYAAGRWQRHVANKAYQPYIRYVAVRDDRTRPQHRAWHGTILPVDHPWWSTHFPPCGWNCRCTTQGVSERDLARRGWHLTEHPIVFPSTSFRNKRTGEVSMVPGGIDPGFAYNVGQAYLGGLMPPLLEMHP